MLRFLIIFIFFPIGLFAQISGLILDSLTLEPLSFVAVVHERQKTQVFSDLNGKFIIQATEEDTLWFKMPGYVQQKMKIKNNQTIYLQSITLNEVQISAKDNPAYRHIRLAQKFKDQNNPANFPSFFYRSYTKIIAFPEPKANVKLDSIFQNMYMIFWEVVTERNYQKPKSQEKVISERISGMPGVVLPFSPSDFQDLSFYDNYVKILGTERCSPIGNRCFSEFDYEMSDTSWSGNDTIFSIRFFPKNKSIPTWTGFIRLQTTEYQIVSIDATNEYLEINQLKHVRFRQLYEPKKEGKWFPVEYQTDFQMNGRNALPISFEVKTKIYDFQLDTLIKIKGVQSIVMEDAADTSKMSKLRPEELSEKAEQTFVVLDSMGGKIPTIRLLKDLPSLLEGYIPGKYIDWDLRRFILYNEIEKLRLGLGIRTSRSLSKVWRLGAWMAYGFGDKTFKYGGNFSLTPFKNKDIEWFSDYFHDLNAIGQAIVPTQQLLWKPEYANFQTQWLFQTKLVYRNVIQSQIKWPVRNWLNVQLGVNQTEAKAFNEKWNYESAFSIIRFSPGEKRTGIMGKSLLMETSTWPVISLHVTAGRFLNQTYEQFQIQWKHNILIHKIGKFSYRLLAGKNIGKLPYDQIFIYPALNSDNYISFDGTFQTMGIQKYQSSLYFCGFVQQTLNNQRFPNKKYNPDLTFHLNAAWNPKENYQTYLYDLESFTEPFYEAGISLTNIFPEAVTRISPAFQWIGLGFFARFGPHYTNHFSQDFGFKITSLLN